MFSATFAGIAPSSAPGFIAAQIAGAVVACVIIKVLYPAITAAQAADVVLPHLHANTNPGTGTGPSGPDHSGTGPQCKRCLTAGD
jgi:glycerol uptake facilitator-like aquaporin